MTKDMSKLFDDIDDVLPEEDDLMEEIRPRMFGASIDYYKGKGRIEKNDILNFGETIPEMPNSLFVYEHECGMRFLGVYEVNAEGNIGNKISDVLYLNND